MQWVTLTDQVRPCCDREAVCRGTVVPHQANLKLTAEQIAHAQATRSSAPETFWKTPAQGAATSVLVATSAVLDGVGGRYFEDGQEAAPHVPGTMSGVAAYALDPEQAGRLWEVSETLLT